MERRTQEFTNTTEQTTQEFINTTEQTTQEFINTTEQTTATTFAEKRICCGCGENKCCRTKACRFLHAWWEEVCCTTVCRQFWENSDGGWYCAQFIISYIITFTGMFLTTLTKNLRQEPYNWNRASTVSLAYVACFVFCNLVLACTYYCSCTRPGSFTKRFKRDPFSIGIQLYVMLALAISLTVGFYFCFNFFILSKRTLEDELTLTFLALFWGVLVSGVVACIVFFIGWLFVCCYESCCFARVKVEHEQHSEAVEKVV